MKRWQIGSLLGLILLAATGLTSWLVTVRQWDALEAFMVVTQTLAGCGLLAIVVHCWQNPDSF